MYLSLYVNVKGHWDCLDVPPKVTFSLQLFDGNIGLEGHRGFTCGTAIKYGPYKTKTNVLFVLFHSDGQPDEEMYEGVDILYKQVNGKYFHYANMSMLYTEILKCLENNKSFIEKHFFFLILLKT